MSMHAHTRFHLLVTLAVVVIMLYRMFNFVNHDICSLVAYSLSIFPRLTNISNLLSTFCTTSAGYYAILRNVVPLSNHDK
jgi:hypothetical protein